MSELELAGLTGPVRGSLPGHGLDVTVPFEVERVETEIDGATALLAGLVIGRVAADRLDLPIAVSVVVRLVEHLQHDVDVRLLSAELLHEVLHDDVHERIVPLARDVRDDVAEEDRIRADAKVVLDLTKDDLLARPTMLDDSLEPGVIRHE